MTEEEFKALPIKIEVIDHGAKGAIHIDAGEKKYMSTMILDTPGQLSIKEVLTTIELYQYLLAPPARPF